MPERKALNDKCDGRGPLGIRLILDELKRLDRTELEVMGELRVVEPNLLVRTHESAIQESRNFTPDWGRSDWGATSRPETTRLNDFNSLKLAEEDLKVRSRLGLTVPSDALAAVRGDLDDAQRWLADHQVETRRPWAPPTR